MYSIDCMKKIKTIIPLIITFCMNAVVYWGVPLLRTGIKTHNLSGPADEVIPFMPQFIIIYFGCYLFWQRQSQYMEGPENSITPEMQTGRLSVR